MQQRAPSYDGSNLVVVLYYIEKNSKQKNSSTKRTKRCAQVLRTNLNAQTPRTSSAQTLRTNLVHKLQTHSKNLETQTIDLLGPSNCHRDPTRSVQVRKSPRPPNPCKCGNTCILIEPFKLLVRRLVRELVRLLVRDCLCGGLCGGL